MLFMGIDVGSSGVKVSVVNEEGKLVCFSTQKYSFTYENGRSELSPNEVFDKVCLAIKEITQKNNIYSLSTVSVTSFGEMFVLLDENKEVLCPSISYNDMRGREEAEMLCRSIGVDKIYSITGATPNAMYSLPKLLWIKNNRPDIYKKAKKLCLFADFILIKLGAEFHTDYSLAARTLMFDVRERIWSREMIEGAGIDASLLCEPVPMGKTVGKISAGLASELGLPGDVILLAGGHDQSCAALGAGITGEGMALDGMGSNECIVPCFDKPMVNERMKSSNLVCVPYAIDGLYVTYAFNRSSGTVLDWYKKIMRIDDYSEIFDDIDERPSKVLFLPHFSGAATPYMDDDAVGAVVGLDLETSKADLAKGLIQGLNFEMMVNLSCLSDAGFKVKELYTSGGMSKSDKVLQIKANVLGLPVNRLAISETGTLAMAIMGSVAMGAFPDVKSAVSGLVKTEKSFYPDEMLHVQYQEIFEKYKNVYSAVKTVR